MRRMFGMMVLAGMLAIPFRHGGDGYAIAATAKENAAFSLTTFHCLGHGVREVGIIHRVE